MQQKIFIVLGSPNSPSGKLSEISKSRLKYCQNYFEEGNLILCTGGWGAHFNTSINSHASYSKIFLMEAGLSENAFLEFALSSNTVDDAVKIKPIVSKFNNPQLIIITSDYHLNRVELIFSEVIEKYNMEFVGVASNLDKEEYNNLVVHEKKAIRAIIENGLYY